MKDKLNTPLEKAVFHIERVLKHGRSIKNLQNTNARKLNIFQFHSLDVISLILIVIGITTYVLKRLVGIILGQIRIFIFGARKVDFQKKEN